MQRRAIQPLIVLALTAVCTAGTMTTAAHAAPSGCAADTYFELDAYGYVTGYPGARCAPGEYFDKGGIDATLTVDGQYVGDSRSTFTPRRSGGVYGGRGIAARNGPGRNQFCVITSVSWNVGLGTQYRTGRDCVVY